MCDKSRVPKKKVEVPPKPPTPGKIMRRIKLEGKVDKILEEPSSTEEEVVSTPTETFEESVEEEKVVEKNLEEIKVLEQADQDRLVEEILRNRILSRSHSSFQAVISNNSELLATADDKKKIQTEMKQDYSSSGSGSEDSIASSRSSVSQMTGKKISINTLLKERILYHGLNKYLDDYDKEKYRYPVPKPKKRISAIIDEPVIILPVVGDDDDSESHISSDSSSSLVNIVFDHDSKTYKSGTETKAEEEEDEESIVPVKSRQSVMSTISKFQFESNFEEEEEEDDGENITEQIIALEANVRRESLKERYVHDTAIKGYAKCIDTTIGYPECLPPGEIVRMAIRPDKLWGVPMNKPLSKEQFIDLISRIENYPTNDYIFLSYVYPPKTLEFNPYLFKIVPFKDVDSQQYFTLSKSGIMHFRNGFAEYTSIVKFIKQIYIYERIRTIPFFMLYPLYKSFTIWISNIRQTKMKKNRKQLEELLFTAKRPLRGMLSLLFRMIEKISEMGLISLRPTVVYNVSDFVTVQANRLKDITRRFRTFEKMVMDLTETACRTYLIECGFSAENYAGEVQFYMRELSVPLDALSDEAGNFLDYPGQWLPYSLQAKKKRICERLSNFIHLVDFYVQRAYHRILKNSVLVLMCELHHRVKKIPKAYGETPQYIFKYGSLKKKNENLIGKIEISGGDEPMFEMGCSYNEETLTFSPSNEDFHKYIKNLFNIWKNGIGKYKNLLPDDAFNPYTQPIVNGYMQAKKCGDGPSIELLYNTDPDLFEIYDTIAMIFNNNFDACKEYVDGFDYVRIFCLENNKMDLSKIRKEENVQVLTQMLEKYHNQLNNTVSEMEGETDVGIFRIDNTVLRDNALPSIMRIIEVLHEIVPMIGGKEVRALTARMETAIATLEKEPKTADEYVDYLLFIDNIQEEQMDDMERELDICSEISDLIDTYQMSGNDEDVGGYTGLVPLLNQLRNLVDYQMMYRENLILGLMEQFQIFNDKVLVDVEEVLLRAYSPQVLDPQSRPSELAHSLGEDKDLLVGYQEHATRFNRYQNQFKLEVTNYDRLEEVLQEVKLRHLLWNSMKNLDTKRNEWDHLPFKDLNADEIVETVTNFTIYAETLENDLPPNAVVPILKAKVDSLVLQLPLIIDLRNPNLKRRHWEELEKVLDQNLTNELITLTMLNEAGIQQYAEFIHEISSQATSEFEAEFLQKNVGKQSVLGIVFEHVSEDEQEG